ncbi:MULTISPECIES: carbohydrate ABC transporter permease [unclassified Paenibacillus]|uniref:carbohydrate ABC transporter permease n=1 Tax=unclassified Paenibacillus TaxID=185978 RepID=UPI00363346E7
MRSNQAFGSRLFEAGNVLLLLVVTLLCLLPFAYVIVSSFASTDSIIPKGFSLVTYEYIFSTGTFIKSLGISIYITVLGTFINLLFTTTMAYPLSRSTLLGRKPVLFLVMFTMLFSGGMIPAYFVVKWFGLINSLWALMIPNAISAFNLIILRNFFQQIPEGLEESAKIDGCTDFGIFFRIILPLSVPALATFGLFYAVTHWNSYVHAILYLNDNTKWPVQVLMRNIIILANSSIGDGNDFDVEIPPQPIKMAVIVVSTLPILLVYPFLQKHFAKGVLVGSIKG